MLNAILMLSGLAFAGDPPAEAEKPAAEQPAEEADAPAEAEKAPEFADLDKDASKTIEPTEAKLVASLEAAFATVDADKDGKLSKAEFDAWSKASTVQ